MSSPTVRLAYGGPVHALAHALRPGLSPPALLVSYVYTKQFDRHRPGYHFRDWSMDSGAFSAEHSGKKIDLTAYTDECLRRLATDPQLVEVFALDVISDWRASLKNAEYMWSRGVPAIPTWHRGEPWSVLVALARDYPKIGVGGIARVRGPEKHALAGQVFARVWPKKVHGLGVGGESLIMGFPFHSVDATNWEAGPTRFGSWSAYGGANLGLRGGAVNLRVQVDQYLQIERNAQSRWVKEMGLIP